ncbi:DUF2971 domain-containing protein [Shewanella sp. YLB-07]|uniref:DUF2971 domain-containing protein n=1 Tax=Shewanella sp. YLB-07 TaxID=2601268 RepID=UPI00128CA6B0|nr:DUF2971 domain-containing protein [Shewanella sp. YLB-07]MPY25008.1 DUF2971 domain-containing protein [Shewanella sp. YLB-07]
MKIIENNSVGFSQPCNFNDPFELEASYPSEGGDNPVDSLFKGVRSWIKKDIWKRTTGILSLTRQPLNPLMWAHYSVEHTGMVIGFDSNIEAFTCEDTNLVPIQYGSVIYTGKKPDSRFLSKPTETMEVGGTFHFPYGQLERLQRMFLFKPMCWSYEEEVRIVKCLKGVDKTPSIKSGEFSEIEVSGRPIYLLSLPKGTIKEIYLGVRSSTLKSTGDHELYKVAKEHQPKAKIFACTISKSSWSLECSEL